MMYIQPAKSPCYPGLVTLIRLFVCFLSIKNTMSTTTPTRSTSPTIVPTAVPTTVPTTVPTFRSTRVAAPPILGSTKAAGLLPAQQSRTEYCNPVHFYIGDGLKRYFECCDTQFKPRICWEECPCLLFGGYCDRTTKSCRCPAGRTGTHCANECSSGHYGVECIEECTCGVQATCDPVNGLCTCAEDSSLNGSCQRCMDGMYGPTCKIPCLCDGGGLCHSNGACLKGTTTVASSYLALAVVLGVVLGVVLIVACILYAYFMNKLRKKKHKGHYVSFKDSDIPFDVGVGRNSLDLLDSSLSAPRNLGGLMRFLNNNPAYMRQTSGMENRVLPNIPEAQSAFLAADGTEQPIFELEPISNPSPRSARSFDPPTCAGGTTADSIQDGYKTDEDGAPMERPPPPPGTSPIFPPHIIINTSPKGSHHGTPMSSPSGSMRSTRSYESPNLPVARPNRSASSPNPFLQPSDYDRFDRTRSKSLVSGTSSAGESGVESYDVLRPRHQRRRSNNSRTSLNKKRLSIDRMADVSRTDESDTESDDSAPMLPDKRAPSIPAEDPVLSSDSISSSDPMLPLNINHTTDIGSTSQAGDGYSRVPAFPGFVRSLTSPSNLSTSSVTEDPYMVTNLADWQPTPGEHYHPSNSDNNVEVAGVTSKAEDKGMPGKKNDYETPVYAKPRVKSNANNDGSNGLGGNSKPVINIEFVDEQHEANENQPEAIENQPEVNENQPEVNENQSEADNTSEPQNHDYFVLNIPKRSSYTSDKDEDESSRPASNNEDINDYEIPDGDLMPPTECNQDVVSGELGTPEVEQANDESHTKANHRVRVDDYETPMVELMKPSSPD